MTLRIRLRKFVIIILSSFTASGLFAQQNMQRFATELSVSAGGVFLLPGATADSTICDPQVFGNCNRQTHFGKKVLPAVDAAGVVSLNKWIGFYAQYSYVFTDRNHTSVTFPPDSSATTTASRHYWIAGGGVEFRAPTIHGVVPVFRVGAAGVHDSYNFLQSGVNINPEVIQHTDARTILAGTGAAGIKWYIRERQGLQFMVDGFYLTHTVPSVDASPSFLSTALVNHRSGGMIAVGYFILIGR